MIIIIGTCTGLYYNKESEKTKMSHSACSGETLLIHVDVFQAN